MAVGIFLQWTELAGVAADASEALSVQLRLRPGEAALLAQILRSYLSDLRMEIAGTESYDMRQQLKQDEEVIKEFIARLDAVAPAVS